MVTPAAAAAAVLCPYSLMQGVPPSCARATDLFCPSPADLLLLHYALVGGRVVAGL